MAVGGTKPVPRKLKILRGNPGQRPLPKNEPQPQASKLKSPVKLSPLARKQWRLVAKQLGELGLLTVLDEHALVLYCEAFARFRKASEELEAKGLMVESPNGYLIPSPCVSIVNQSTSQMMKILTEFGMTPSSRTRVAAPGKASKDEWKEFFNDE